MFSQKSIDVSAGSVIMAVGIFLLGAIHQFPYISNFLLIFSILLVIIWGFMITRLIKSLFNKNYVINLLNTPIKCFGAGTWIAGTSVVGIIITLYFPKHPALIVLLIANIVIWLLFITFCIWQLKQIVTKGMINEVHGAILLTTVSTQSNVCFLVNYFGQVNKNLVNILIAIGIVFYLFSISLIIVRFSSKWRDIFEWKNTDCIIHGALSITGLSMTLSGNFHISVLIFVWYVVFSLFVIVELFDVVRGIERIKIYGWGKGIFTYDISQWSRNFTFGMFYYFTYNLIHSSPYHLQFLSYVMYVVGWAVLVLLTVELFIMLKSYVSMHFIFK